MTDVFALDLDEELLSHLAIPDSIGFLWTEKVTSELILDPFVEEVFIWQFAHMREHNKAATASVLAEQFDLDFEDPLTAIGDLIERLRTRYMRNKGREKMEPLTETYKSDPTALPATMIKIGRDLSRLIDKRGEQYGTGDYPRAMQRYDELVLRGPGPSLGFKEFNDQFHGAKGVSFTLAPPKTYKALSLDTPIPIPDGWTTMDKLAIGDIVFDQDGNQCNVIGKSPVWNDRPCYRVKFSDGTSIIADGEHLWETDMRDKGRGVRTTEEIRKTLLRSDKGHNHSIPVAGSLVCAFRTDLPVDPYVLGAWLGDGTSREAVITTRDEGIITEIRNANHTVSKWLSADYAYGIGGLSKALRLLNIRSNKHIPNRYLRADYEDRLALLQGLMDTDGHCTERGECVFVTTSLALRNGVLELIRSLGLKPTANEYRATLNDIDCGPKWHIGFTAYINQPVFRLARKIERMRINPNKYTRSQTRQIVAITPIESVPVQCITVNSKNHLYLAGEGMIPTHNSWKVVNDVIDNVTLGNNTYLYSLELPAEETDMRIRCMAADIPYWRYLRGSLSKSDRNKLAEASEFLDSTGIYSCIKPEIGHRTVEEMIERAGDAGADYVIIDQLQYVETQNNTLLGSAKPQDYWQPLNAARDLSDHIPIMFVHQFNRSVMNADKMPEMQQAKGSSHVEEVATLILGMWANKDMRRSNVFEIGTLASRNYTYESWEIGVELSHGCDLQMLGKVNHDEEEY